MIEEILSLVRQLEGCRGRVVRPDSNLLVELDLDSLALLELAELVHRAFDIHILAEPYSLRDIATPADIAQLVLRSRPGSETLSNFDHETSCE